MINMQLIQGRKVSGETHCKMGVQQERVVREPVGSSHVPGIEGRLELVALKTNFLLKPALTQ